MSDNVFDDTMQGLQEAIAYVKGDKSKARSHLVAIAPLKEYSKDEIRELRNKNNMTQRVFAEIVGVSQKTVEAWETGTNKPSGSAVRLFQLMESDHSFVDRMIIRN